MDGQTASQVAITRVFDASRQQVFRAFIEPERIRRWWGPANFTAPVIQVDPRPGGRYLYCMRSPDGRDFYSIGEFKEIVPPEKLITISPPPALSRPLNTRAWPGMSRWRRSLGFAMCRNIKPLFNFEPPATEADVRAAALQFVRKISGYNKPSRANQAAFDAAVEEIAAASARLLAELQTHAGPRRA